MPVEVLENSLRFLLTRSLKKARLTCKHWGAVGARYLFHRIYFTPRKEVIEIFLKIVGNEAFASNIEELIYDSRLFADRMDEVERYPRRISSYFPGEFSNEGEIEDEAENEWSEWKRYDDSAANSDNGASASQLPPYGSGTVVTAGAAQRRSQSTSLAVESLVDRAAKYRRLLREQKAIFRFRKDLGALCTGLRRLPRLRKVSVLYHFPSLHGDPFGFSWYKKWSAQLCEGTTRQRDCWTLTIEVESLELGNGISEA